MKIVGLIIFVGVISTMSIMCLFYPEKVQNIAIWSVSHGYLTKGGHLEDLVRSKKYIIIVKSVGYMAFLCLCFLAWVIYRT